MEFGCVVWWALVGDVGVLWRVLVLGYITITMIIIVNTGQVTLSDALERV